MGNVIGHVDDFLIMGDHGNGCFTRMRAAIAGAYRWSPWQLGELVNAGIRIRQRMDFSITLDQQEYLDNLEAVKIAEYRVPMDKEPLTAAEVRPFSGRRRSCRHTSARSSACCRARLPSLPWRT